MGSPYLERRETPEYRAGPASSGFYVDLFLEHLSEGSFLYEQRIALLTDPELTWPDLDDFEERLEAHVDALVVGGDLATAVCRQRLREGDFGEAYVALRVACRRRNWEMVEQALGATEPDDADRWVALRDALRHEAPAEWAGAIGRLLDGAGPAADLAAEVIGDRRLPAGESLLAALHRDGPPSAAVVRALGKVGHRPALPALTGRPLREGDARVRTEAALACLRLGEGGVVNYALSQSAPGAATVAAMGGGPTASRRLLDLSAAGPVDADLVLALGLLGDPAAVPALLYHLRDETLAEGAAMALHLLTGAGLFETVQVAVEEPPAPEPAADGEADDETDGETDEEAGEAAGAEAGEEAPATVPTRQPVRDPVAWTEWWDANAGRFAAGTRYRGGELAAPGCLIASLLSEELPAYVRQLAADELAIRYACPVAFEADHFVREQRAAISAMEDWSRSIVLQPGAWYLAGRRLSV